MTVTDKANVIIHGVFVNIFNTGTLITGSSACGKSTLALDLITRGHQLIADDAPEFYPDNEAISGRCPTELQDQLHVRELGFINVRDLLGEQAIRQKQILQLIVNLDMNTPDTTINIDNHWQKKSVLHCNIPMVNFPAHSPHLIALIETAVILRNNISGN